MELRQVLELQVTLEAQSFVRKCTGVGLRLQIRDFGLLFIYDLLHQSLLSIRCQLFLGKVMSQSINPILLVFINPFLNLFWVIFNLTKFLFT
jgi:hypothetical protein